MKKTIATVMISISLLSSALAGNYISSVEAIRYEGQIKTVCGPIAQVTDSQKATFVNFDRPYPNQSFSAVIWKSNYKQGEIKEMLIPMINNGEEQNICIEGRIKTYKGVPNITIEDIEQIIEEQ